MDAYTNKLLAAGKVHSTTAMLQRWGRTRSQTNEARGCAHAHNEGSATFFADSDDDQDLGLED